MRLKYATHKNLIWMGGMGAFYYNADHLILQRMEAKMRAFGIYHQGNF